MRHLNLKSWVPVLLLGMLSVAAARPVFAQAADPAAVFQTANQDYRNGHYDQAIGAYEQLREQFPQAAVLYFNLANSYFRTGQIGKAILNYERALLYDPRHEDSRSNLDFSRGVLEYRIEDTRNWYLRAGERLLQHFREREVLLLVLICYFLFIGGWAYSLFFKPGMPWGWRRKSILVILALALALFFAKNLETRFFRDAIIIENDAEVRYGPSDADQIAFRLGEGLKVYVVDRRKEWSRVLLVSGKGGWIRNQKITEVMKLNPRR